MQIYIDLVGRAAILYESKHRIDIHHILGRKCTSNKSGVQQVEEIQCLEGKQRISCCQQPRRTHHFLRVLQVYAVPFTGICYRVAKPLSLGRGWSDIHANPEHVLLYILPDLCSDKT